MTKHESPAPGSAPASAANLPAPSLPLVSIVVVNWNYGNFLRECLRTVQQQDYPHLEIIVFDNGSTDNSRSIMEEFAKADPRFKLILHPENIGQLQAGLRCLDMVKGEFICFVDSDDYLLKDFVSTHVQVHLGLAFGVAITSSNAYEISEENRFVCGGRREFQELVSAQAEHLRPLEARPPRLPGIADKDYYRLSRLVHFRNHDVSGWLWSPGTSNCYRRSVIEMIRPDADLEISLRIAIDTQFAQIGHWIGNTVLIDKCLSAYRIHGKNFHTSLQSIRGLAGHNTGPVASRSAIMYQLILRIRILLNCQRKLLVSIGRERFWEVLKEALNVRHLRREILADAELRAAFSESIRQIFQTLGVRDTIKGLRVVFAHHEIVDLFRDADFSGLPRSRIYRVLWQAHLLNIATLGLKKR